MSEMALHEAPSSSSSPRGPAASEDPPPLAALCVGHEERGVGGEPISDEGARNAAVDAAADTAGKDDPSSSSSSSSAFASFPAIARLASVIASKVSLSSSAANAGPKEQKPSSSASQQQPSLSSPSSPRSRPSKWSPSGWRRRRQRKREENAEESPRRSSPSSSRSPSASPSASRLQQASSPSNSASPSHSRGRTPSPRGGVGVGGDTNTLQVPSATRVVGSASGGSVFGGAVPRRQRPVALLSASSSTEEHCATDNSSEVSTPASSSSTLGAVPKRCFCGLYSEGGPGAAARKHGGRCRLCRSRAKYVSGHKSFDTAATSGRMLPSFLEGGYRGIRQARRAISEDRRSDGHTTEDTSASTSSGTTAQSSFDDRSTSPSSSRAPLPRSSAFPFSTPPFLRRQDRMETVDPPSPNLLTVPSPQFPSAAAASPRDSTRDHGLRTPPAPPTATSSSTSPLESATTSELSHRMAHEMPEYLAPPPRSSILGRAHTDPSSLYETHARHHRPPPLLAIRQHYHSARSHGGGRSHHQPTSPPPTYSEAIREPRLSTTSRHVGPGAPPSYEEALLTAGNAATGGSHCGQIPEIRSPQTLADQLRQQHHHHHQPGRSLSEERTGPTSGAWSSSSSSTSGRGGRMSMQRPLTRSSRAEEIPDIYWEQAARELDFCTCRKCQARYRQYFEESPLSPVGLPPGLGSSALGDDGLLPMETQVFMQEVLTDGIAFCAIM